MILSDLGTKEERLKLLNGKVQIFAERAWKHDKEASFPVENIEDLKKIGYHTLTVPLENGGLDISLLELVQMQEIIAQADGSTALSIGWHMGIVKHLGEKRTWEAGMFQKFCEDVLQNGALLNNAASESGTGSPTRGGRPETTAFKVENHWLITGRKTFTTMSPVLDYFAVSASIQGTNEIGNFLIHKDRKGVTIEETWDSVAMRGTGSHDLVLTDVKVPNENLVEYITPGKKQAAGWLLHIPACYLGIAKAAQKYAIQFASNYSPNSIEGTIADLPYVRQKIGEMELSIQQSQHFLYSVARNWDEGNDNERQELRGVLGAVKHAVVNHAIKIVDLAMRVTGARSLSEKNPLQRYYRDVRAGLHNPPMDDATILLLAEDAIKKANV
ncbi:acyl-CoA dehydrogenase family protein [Anaerobacillus isosaccharinicus]|uniref:Acyl-CoA dehydrogenase n=1 Tax=Anaerobacillus isosaccharinicus TaxID=1532552 RepID=A0A1S2LJ24_9BACI|nr:acyl-CoA dehydrogenase family protein [Anaerobacillus isosaccharinicus]QOY38739.1 acyl-CoA/acyl-ACP dehydrogenase [Anaerobacillus isosaccharinicus]